MLDKSELERIADITAKSGTWVMFDNTYEEFDLEGKPHYALNRPNFIHLFSFSKVCSKHSPLPSAITILELYHLTDSVLNALLPGCEVQSVFQLCLRVKSTGPWHCPGIDAARDAQPCYHLESESIQGLRIVICQGFLDLVVWKAPHQQCAAYEWLIRIVRNWPLAEWILFCSLKALWVGE